MTHPGTYDADDFVLTLWTADVALAERADAAGVQRIGVDLERLGKLERQRGRGTWISTHTIPQLAAVARLLRQALPFVRINPLHDGTASEIEQVIEAGAAVVMLPMVHSGAEAATCADMLGGRARLVLLVESREGLSHLDAMLDVQGVDEVHLGLNDLALSLGLRNRWLTLGDDMVNQAAALVRAAGRRLGLGGLGRPGDRTLPIPSDLIYSEYARLGATGALVARSFGAGSSPDLTADIRQARAQLATCFREPPDTLAARHQELLRRASAADTW